MNRPTLHIAESDLSAIVRHLGYVHREVVRNRLYFVAWMIEMSLLQMEQDHPSIRADVADLKERFHF